MIVDDEQFKKGLERMAEIGRPNTMLDQKALSEDLYRYSVGFLFGEIWNRPHLSTRDRQLITLAANVATSRPTGSHNHFMSARRQGITHEEIIELILHVGMYGGWPCIAHAVKQYTEVLEKEGLPPVKEKKRASAKRTSRRAKKK
jgi:4-carboxymuconolactone decarboxylase